MPGVDYALGLAPALKGPVRLGEKLLQRGGQRAGVARLEEQHEKADNYLAKAAALRQRGQVDVDSSN